MSMRPVLAAAPGWRGHLQLDYGYSAGRTTAHDRHEGPLRVLQPLYPEGPGICHHVLLHPPGGIVAGDELHIDIGLGAGAHAVLTTPGATRFYRSEGALALQRTALTLAAGARAEWLPLETLAYSGCQADNRWQARLAPGAELLGWDMLALGLPAAGQPFAHGCYRQRIELPGVWLEQARIDAGDRVLLDGGPGWAGQRVLGTAWFAAGQTLLPARRAALLDGARAAIDAQPLALQAGATSPQPSLLLVRVLADGVEPLMQLLMAVRAAWRRAAWGLDAAAPRIWRT